jgi:hypothetical protein
MIYIVKKKGWSALRIEIGFKQKKSSRRRWVPPIEMTSEFTRIGILGDVFNLIECSPFLIAIPFQLSGIDCVYSRYRAGRAVPAL